MWKYWILSSAFTKWPVQGMDTNSVVSPGLMGDFIYKSKTAEVGSKLFVSSNPVLSLASMRCKSQEYIRGVNEMEVILGEQGL